MSKRRPTGYEKRKERPRKGGWAYSRNKEYSRRNRRVAERDIRTALDGDYNV